MGDAVATAGEAGGFVWREAARYEIQSQVAAELGMRGDGCRVQSSKAAEAFSDADTDVDGGVLGGGDSRAVIQTFGEQGASDLLKPYWIAAASEELPLA